MGPIPHRTLHCLVVVGSLLPSRSKGRFSEDRVRNQIHPRAAVSLEDKEHKAVLVGKGKEACLVEVERLSNSKHSLKVDQDFSINPQLTLEVDYSEERHSNQRLPIRVSQVQEASLEEPKLNLQQLRGYLEAHQLHQSRLVVYSVPEALLHQRLEVDFSVALKHSSQQQVAVYLEPHLEARLNHKALAVLNNLSLVSASHHPRLPKLPSKQLSSK